MSTDGPLTGRRIAMLVYNDLSSDARVIKEATALSEAGAEVRVIALAVARGRYAPGLDRSRPAFETLRVPIVEIKHLLPIWGDAVRRLIRRSSTPAVAPAPTPAPTPTTPSPSSSAAPAPPAAAAPAARAPIGELKGVLIDLWGRLDLTLRMASYWRRARRELLAWRPDAIHAHDANTLSPAARAARRLRIPLVYDSHELWTERNVRADRPFAKRWERIVERRGIRRAELVVTVSPSIARWLQDRYRLTREPLLVRNIPAASPTAGDRGCGRLRELASLPDDARVLVYCGGVTTNRGIERVVDALAHLPADHHLVAIGPASEIVAAQLRRRAVGVGAAGRLHLVGSVDSHEVTTALADGDVSFVLTNPSCLSYRYSLPNKLFESLHAGLPIIANDLPDTGAIVSQSGAGVIVGESADSRELADAVRSVLVDRERLSRAALAAAQEHRWEDDIEALVAAYSAMTSRHRPGGPHA
ncbi:glycosyltransferase [Yonghaparkia sp. Soil809]|uniref:glycosyltransferase n=1 Tax=Yonghaparkia sp. Soil809 TaxID=1736417 RepID=UPI00138F29B8|nr:glycosyltransferase [Yonghaparkia sp. Soil809]